MVTIFSNTESDIIYGEEPWDPTGEFSVDFQSEVPLSLHDRLFVDIALYLECTPIEARNEGEDTITFNTVADPSEPQDHFTIEVRFDIGDRDDEVDSVSDVVLAAMRQWF